MKKSVEFKQDRTVKIGEQSAIVAKAKTENRELTTEENASIDALQVEIEALTVSVNRAISFEANELLVATREGNPINTPPAVDEPKEIFSIHRAIRSQMPSQNLALTGVDLETVTRARTIASASNLIVTGVAIPLQNRAQTVTGDSGTKGGNLVATDLQAPIDFLRPLPLIEGMGATYMVGLTGNLRFPKNEGGIVASWEGETSETPETSNVYGYVDMTPNRLSVTVPISLQNILQSSIDLEMYTINQINLAIANKLDLAAINGSGIGNEPLGLLNNSDVNVVTTAANGSEPTWDMLVDMETKVFVENANAAKMKYLVNPKTRGKLKKTKHQAGDLNYIMDTTGTVNGYESAVSNVVPGNIVKGTSGATTSAAVFGDWSQLIIGQWGIMDLSVDEFSRKKEGLIEVTVNVFMDVLAKQPKAFTVVKGLITV